MADTGFGITVAWTTNTQMNALQVADVSVGSTTRALIPVPHYGTTAGATNKVGNIPYIASDLIDGPPITITYYSSWTVEVPTYDAADTVTFTWPDASTWAGSFIVTDTSFSNPIDGAATTSVTIKCTGEITEA